MRAIAQPGCVPGHGTEWDKGDQLDSYPAISPRQPSCGNGRPQHCSPGSLPCRAVAVSGSGCIFDVKPQFSSEIGGLAAPGL